MGKVLYIKANPKPEGYSRTCKVSDHFIEEYKKNNPEDEVVTIDLYNEQIDFLREEDLKVLFSPKTEESKNHPVLKYAYQFAEADKYIVAAPMWNLGNPAILKAYIDYVSVSGITFTYGEQGPVGLCSGKKALFVAGRGGDYTNPFTEPFEMGEKYIRTVFGFFGVCDFTVIPIENLDKGNNSDEIVNEACKTAELIAKKF
ncbi:MAG: NAD(P)H-dependent oxidoreductase [Clostridium sp.]